MYCTSLETEYGCYDDSNISDDSKNMDTVNMDTIDVSKFYVNIKDRLKFALLNINSLRHKLYPIKDVLQNNYIDILMLQETKLDESFLDAQFNIQGFMLHRLDHRNNAEGLIMYVRGDFSRTEYKG